MFTSCILLHFFPTHFQFLLGILVVSPYFSIQLAHNNKGKSKTMVINFSLSGDLSAGLVPKVSGSKGRQGMWMELFKQLLQEVTKEK